ncbi:hypothetical protein ACIA8G_39430 [Lentzea sp. NPDC051213]|uniref:hypothetical protein n=1 Tax=Lentzea sp. NPDC051213 TaxID=3364126 RepID=UPI0037BDF53C
MRMLIWTPLNAAELQQAMYGGNVGPAALVPVQSGTVLLVSPTARQLDALALVMRLRKISPTPALVAVWDAEAAVVYPSIGAISRGWTWGEKKPAQRLIEEASQFGWFGRLYNRSLGWMLEQSNNAKTQTTIVERLTKTVPQAAVIVVDALVRDYRAGAGVIPKLFRALGLPDVAQVAELVDQGRADTWLEPLASPRLPMWVERLYLWGAVAALVFILVVTTPIWLKLVLALLAGSYFLVASMFRKRAVGAKPINTVLPVIPVTQGAAPTD